MAGGLVLGVVYLAVGLIPAVPRNRYVGVRTPWTRRSDHAWRESNRLARPLFLVAGAVTIAVTLLAPDAGMWAGVGLAVTAAVILTAYSYWLWSNDPDRQS